MGNIMIIGAGTVGMATGIGLAKKGNRVIFIDKRRSVVEKLHGQGYSAYSSDYCEHLDVDVDVSMFCVDTPLSINDSTSGYCKIDLSHLTSAVTTHAIWMRRSRGNPYHLVVIRSTVPPGTTSDTIIPILEKVSGLKAGIDFGVCMQPEFLRSRAAEDDFMHPRIIVVGEYDKRSGDLLHKVYSRFDCRKLRVSLHMAEFMKYIHNCFNATKISFSNEMWLLGQKLGIDSNIALQLASTSAEGFWNPHYGLEGGHPFDGHCLPKDSESLLRFAQDNGLDMRLLSAVIDLNKYMDKMTKPPPNLHQLKKSNSITGYLSTEMIR